jgi:hypothetical protein
MVGALQGARGLFAGSRNTLCSLNYGRLDRNLWVLAYVLFPLFSPSDSHPRFDRYCFFFRELLLVPIHHNAGIYIFLPPSGLLGCRTPALTPTRHRHKLDIYGAVVWLPCFHVCFLPAELHVMPS